MFWITSHTFPPIWAAAEPLPRSSLYDLYIVSLFKVAGEASERQGHRSPAPLQSRPHQGKAATTTTHNIPSTLHIDSLLLLLIPLLLGEEVLLPALGEGDEDHGEEEDEDEEAGHPQHEADYKGWSIRLPGNANKDLC